jgi:hypothetical protein
MKSSQRGVVSLSLRDQKDRVVQALPKSVMQSGVSLSDAVERVQNVLPTSPEHAQNWRAFFRYANDCELQRTISHIKRTYAESLRSPSSTDIYFDTPAYRQSPETIINATLRVSKQYIDLYTRLQIWALNVASYRGEPEPELFVTLTYVQTKAEQLVRLGGALLGGNVAVNREPLAFEKMCNAMVTALDKILTAIDASSIDDQEFDADAFAQLEAELMAGSAEQQSVKSAAKGDQQQVAVRDTRLSGTQLTKEGAGYLFRSYFSSPSTILMSLMYAYHRIQQMMALRYMSQNSVYISYITTKRLVEQGLVPQSLLSSIAGFNAITREQYLAKPTSAKFFAGWIIEDPIDSMTDYQIKEPLIERLESIMVTTTIKMFGDIATEAVGGIGLVIAVALTLLSFYLFLAPLVGLPLYGLEDNDRRSLRERLQGSFLTRGQEQQQPESDLRSRRISLPQDDDDNDEIFVSDDPSPSRSRSPGRSRPDSRRSTFR